MGFLEIGVPLAWEDSLEYRRKVKEDGLKQLVHIWNLNKNREDIDLKWGDEMEYMLIHFDHEKRQARLCINGPAILAKLIDAEQNSLWRDPEGLGRTISFLSGRKCANFLRGSEWHPEYGSHMIEATPNPPFNLSVDSLLDLEVSLLSRRYKLQSMLPPDVYVASLAAFPRFGLGDSLWSMKNQIVEPKGNDSVEMNLSVINPHPRFPTLTANVKERRKRKIAALMPVYEDIHSKTSQAWNQSLDINEIRSSTEIDERSKVTPNPVRAQIYMDSFAYGMGMCCLQTTFGTPNLSVARNLYDQMAVLAPIVLALSAATPMLRGWLSALDTRWKVLEQTCDSRTEDEIGRKESRYGGITTFIGQSDFFQAHQEELNDVKVHMNQSAFQFLRQHDFDPVMARHFAVIWDQDPLVIFEDRVKLDNTTSVDHFENLQSTNWMSVRFKPPPVSLDGKTPPATGWRVELRTADVQLSDFENAALCCLASILAIAVMRYNLNFYIPISKCQENLEEAHRCGAVTKSLFWFRHDLAVGQDSEDPTNPLDSLFSRMSLREIFLGCRRTGAVGLISLMDTIVSEEWRHQRCSRDAVEQYRTYSNYIQQRVLGQAWTDAKVLRHIISTSPLYEGNSQISDPLNYEIAKFGVAGGFSLRPEISPWSLPGCIPSSTRLPVREAFSNISDLPLIRELLKLRTGSNDDIEKAILADEQKNCNCEHHGLGARRPHKRCSISCREKNIDHQQLPVTSADLLHQDFDADLFLQMEQYSR